MKWYFKQATISDLPFYYECFFDKEFQYMLYGNSPLKLSQLENYIAKNSKDYKFVISLDKQVKNCMVGFAHFYHNFDNQYTYVGGIHPNFFNSGLGTLASTAALSLFYDINEQASFDTAIYKHNLRSLRLHLALGFNIIKETEEMYYLSLNKDDFNNDFAMNIRKRLYYQLVNTEL